MFTLGNAQDVFLSRTCLVPQSALTFAPIYAEAKEYFCERCQMDVQGNLTFQCADLNGAIALTAEAGSFEILNRRSPIEKETESSVRLGDTQISVVVEAADANPDGTSYVRFCDQHGHEIAYWNEEEWADAPAEVMGAIFGAIIGNLVEGEGLELNV